MSRFDELEKEADDLLAGLNAQQPEGESASTSPITAESGDAPEQAEGVAAESADTGPAQDTPAEASEQADEMVPLSRYKNAEKLMHQRAQEAADLRRQVAQLQAEIQHLQTRPAATPEKPEPAKPADDSAVAEFKEFYPEIAGPVEHLLAQKLAEVEHIKRYVSELQQQDHQAKLKAHREAILQAHPDAFELAETPDFQVWKQEQSGLVQAALERGSARDVIDALRLFKSSQGSPSQPVDKLAEARKAAGPTVARVSSQPTQPRFTREAIEKMSRAEFEKHEAEIDRQMAMGLIA